MNSRYAVLAHTKSEVRNTYITQLLDDPVTTNYGITSEPIQVEFMPKGDHFKLSIPYAKQNLVWNVLFDLQCPEIGPDFIFNDNSFLTNMDLDTLSTKVPSLAKWNSSDNSALLNVLMELVSCYKQHQMQLLQKQDRLKLEYNLLVESGEVRPEDVETILLPFGSKPMEAKFLISFSVDISQLPNCISILQRDRAMLFITFSGLDWNRVVPQLYFSKSLEEILGRAGLFNLPPFPSNQRVANYLQRIKTSIADKINLILQRFEKKREYITAFISLEHENVVEYDLINFNYAITMVVVEDFCFLLHITIPSEFPKQPPIVDLVSIYHMIAPNIPYKERIEQYPYDPTWKPAKMIIALKSFVCKNAHVFQNHSLQNSLQIQFNK